MNNISNISSVSNKRSDQASARILIFSTAYFPFIGGAEIAVKEITHRIKDFEFDLITSRFSKKVPEKEKIDNVTVYRVGKGTKFDKYLLPISGFLKAKELLKKNKYSLIWSISVSQAGLAALFLKFKNPKLPLLLTVQEGSSKKRLFWRRCMVWPLIKKIFKKADYIQAISKFLADFSKEMGAQCPIEIVANGVNVKEFEKALSISQEKKEKLRKKADIKKDEKVIITVSRLVPKNAIDDLIKSLQYLNIPLKLLILGIGPDEEKLKSLVKKLKLTSKVLFLGHIDYKDLPKYLAISDVFVRPSISEGFGNVFVEATAAGVPIIGTSVGGIPDFLFNEKTGIFCQVRRPKTIARAVERLFKDKELNNLLIENSRKLVEEKYDWNLIAEKMNKIFKKLCVS